MTAFVHPALFYASDDEYLDALVPFVTDGLARREPVAVAVPGDRLSVLRPAAGSDDVLWLDITEAGRNPAGSFRRCCAGSPTRTRTGTCASSASRSGQAARPPGTRRARSTRR